MQAARSEMESLSKMGSPAPASDGRVDRLPVFFAARLRAYQESFPDCTIKIEPGDHRRQLELLRASQSTWRYLRAAGPAVDDLVFAPIFEDELSLHRFAEAPLGGPGAGAARCDRRRNPIVANRTGYT